MPLDYLAVPGGHVYWVPYASGSADADNRPSFSSSNKIGTCDELTFNIETFERKITKPGPGGRRVKRVVTFRRDITLEWTQSEPAKEMFQLMAGADAITLSAGDAAVQMLSRIESIEGWLQVEGSDEADADRLIIAAYCALKVNPVRLPTEQEVQWQCMGTVLDSTLNVLQVLDIT